MSASSALREPSITRSAELEPTGESMYHLELFFHPEEAGAGLKYIQLGGKWSCAFPADRPPQQRRVPTPKPGGSALSRCVQETRPLAPPLPDDGFGDSLFSAPEMRADKGSQHSTIDSCGTHCNAETQLSTKSSLTSTRARSEVGQYLIEASYARLAASSAQDGGENVPGLRR